MTDTSSQSGDSAYDQEILPYIRRIVAICKRHGLPYFSTVQDGEHSFRIVALNASMSRWPTLQYMILLNEAGHIDPFLDRLVQQALVKGHDSTYLRAMGVPYKGAGTEDGALVRKPPREIDEWAGTDSVRTLSSAEKG